MIGPSVILLISAALGAAQGPVSPTATTSAPVSSESKLYVSSAADGKDAGKLPINLARVYLGATLTDGTTQTPDKQLKLSGLLRDDDSYRMAVPAGKSSFILILPQNTAAERFACAVEETSGTIKIYASGTSLDMTSPWWQQLGKVTTISRSGPVGVDWAWADVRYVKIELDLKTAGRIGCFGLFGAPTLNDVKVSSPSKNPKQYITPTSTDERTGPLSPLTQQISVGSAAAKGRVAYVSSGQNNDSQSALNMIDNDVNTAYVFEPQDPNPMMIVGLDEPRSVCRISTYQDSGPGRWDVYPLNGLPGDETLPTNPAAGPVPKVTHSAPFLPRAWSLKSLSAVMTPLVFGQTAPVGTLNLPSNFFNDNKPTEPIICEAGNPYGAIEFDPQDCHYVLLRWVPDSSSPSTGMRVFQVSIFTNEILRTRPGVNFASLDDPDLGGARGMNLLNNPVNNLIPVDPPRPPVVSP